MARVKELGNCAQTMEGWKNLGMVHKLWNKEPLDKQVKLTSFGEMEMVCEGDRFCVWVWEEAKVELK